MAQVTMDSSEYESLKKNIKLLEEFKDRESTLNKEIQKLQEEKIQILKDNEKSVTIIKQEILDSYIYTKKDPSIIINTLSQLFSRGANFGVDINSIYEAFFERKEVRSKVIGETITTKGFDEVKEEVKADFYSKLENDKLLDEENRRKEIELIKSLKKQKEELNSELNISNSIRKDLEWRLKFLEADIKTKIEFKEDVRKILKSKWNIFNYLNKFQDLNHIYTCDSALNIKQK